MILFTTLASAFLTLPSKQYTQISTKEQCIIQHAHHKTSDSIITRQKAIGILATSSTIFSPTITAFTFAATTTKAAAAAPSYENKIILQSPISKPLGIELIEVTIGSASRPVLAVKSIKDPTLGGLLKRSSSDNHIIIRPGMVLMDYASSSELKEKLQSVQSYPIELNFVNLAAGGDAFSGDLGNTVVTPQDALDLARQQSLENGDNEERKRNVSLTKINDQSDASTSTSMLKEDEFTVKVKRKPSSDCIIKSRRGDLLEIQYTASYYSIDKKEIVYDSSAQRGTGLPYQTVLGSGDMLPGVDLSMYEMCPGEIRQVNIPKELGYGNKGNRVFRIPGGVSLRWEIELVAVNSVREGDTRTREDLE